MQSIMVKRSDSALIEGKYLVDILNNSINKKKDSLKKVLLLPPDLTRSHSRANDLTNIYYDLLKDICQVDVMPALGTHMPLTDEERIEFFGHSIPEERFIVHNWRHDVKKIGEIPGEFVGKVSNGLVDNSIDVEVNKILIDGTYDLIISLGQVVPHEIAGMANYSKNIFVGCGGFEMISQTHMLGAICGLENVVGQANNPVRKVLDYAQENFLSQIPLMYVLTVTTFDKENTNIEGLFIGDKREVFDEAAKLSGEKNITHLDKPVKKVVAYLDEKEFKTTWLGDKAIYRTSLIIEDGGELLILAPGLIQFGEDHDIDKLIRKYGYIGRDKILKLINEEGNEDIKGNLSAASQMIYGSTNGRYKVTYAVKNVTKEEIEAVNYSYMDYNEAVKKYNPKELNNGFNVMEDGEEIYYVSNPALGLWKLRD